jgi:hypothetical protein
MERANWKFDGPSSEAKAATGRRTPKFVRLLYTCAQFHYDIAALLS